MFTLSFKFQLLCHDCLWHLKAIVNLNEIRNINLFLPFSLYFTFVFLVFLIIFIEGECYYIENHSSTIQEAKCIYQATAMFTSRHLLHHWRNSYGLDDELGPVLSKPLSLSKSRLSIIRTATFILRGFTSRSCSQAVTHFKPFPAHSMFFLSPTPRQVSIMFPVCPLDCSCFSFPSFCICPPCLSLFYHLSLLTRL